MGNYNYIVDDDPDLDEMEEGTLALQFGINSSSTLDEKSCEKFGCIQVTDENNGENWVYIPIKHPITSTFETELPEKLKKASDEALFSAMGIARKALDKSMRQFKSERKSI